LVPKYRERNTLLVLVAIFTILMMGTSQTAHAAYTANAYTAEFWRTSCVDLGTWIQARFTTDIGTSHLIIKAIGSNGTSGHNGFGYFKFDEFTQGYYQSSPNTYQYPGIQAVADYHHYELNYSVLGVTAPVYGTGSAPMFFNTSLPESYSANFSTAADQLQILITQTTTKVWANYSIISSGTTVKTWSLFVDLSSYTNRVQPFTNYGVSDELDGLEKAGYATVLSGTDFQIESVIHPYTATDFTGYKDQNYTHYQSQFTIPPSGTKCFSTYPDDEGTSEVLPSTSTASQYQPSNEAYQYVEVS